MTALPATGYLSNAAREASEMKTAVEDLRDFMAELPGGGVRVTLTIASGTVTPADQASRVVLVDTEGAAAADDLANIAVTNCPEGSVILISCASAARVVTVKNAAGGSGQLALAYSADVQLDHARKWIALQLVSTTWTEIWRSGFLPAGQVLVKTSSYTATVHDHGKTITNEGAGAIVPITLPDSAPPGTRIRFVVMHTNGIRVTAPASNTIRDAASVSSSGGTAENTAVGSVLDLECVSSNTWVSVSTRGTWTLA